jgi:hypothetical protein
MVAEESIYALIPPVVHATSKEPMYRSKFPKNVAPTSSTFGMQGTSKPGVQNVGGGLTDFAGPHAAKKAHATFGKADNRPHPSDILRATKPTLPDPRAFERPTAAAPKPSLPSREDYALAAKRVADAQSAPAKNFVQANAIENILSAPKRGEPPVDWKKKPDFGKVPTYLVNIKREIADEASYIRAMHEAQLAAAPPGMRLMGEGEKDELMFQLKTKWDAINCEYQKTSTLALASLDSIGKIKRCAPRPAPRDRPPRRLASRARNGALTRARARGRLGVRRKEQYEAQLAQIEKDIEKLSKPVIWVHDDGR